VRAPLSRWSRTIAVARYDGTTVRRADIEDRRTARDRTFRWQHLEHPPPGRQTGHLTESHPQGPEHPTLLPCNIRSPLPSRRRATAHERCTDEIPYEIANHARSHLRTNAIGHHPIMPASTTMDRPLCIVTRQATGKPSVICRSPRGLHACATRQGYSRHRDTPWRRDPRQVLRCL
jgi:hypothetical protein